MLWKILLTAVVLYVGICAFMYVFQERFVYHPSKRTENTPANLGKAYDRVPLTTEDGLVINAWFVPADTPRCTVLFFHGNAGSLSDRLETVAIINELDCDLFIIDYRGFGASQGRPSEEGTAKDARAAWKWLVQEKGVPADEIVIWGRSLGGAVAAQLAYEVGKETPPAGLILESTFTSIPDMGVEVYPLLPVRLLTRVQYKSLSLMPDIACPVLVIHSKEDELVPYEMGVALYERAKEPKRFLDIRYKHNWGFMESGALYTDGIDGFLEEVTGP
jgi:hypothetical protein